MTPNPRGADYEAHAARALENAGYTVLERNFSSAYGEIDIIARKDDIIAFIEVKARKERSMVTGFAAVTPAKRRKIIATALYYLKTKGRAYGGLQPRFDVISATIASGGVLACDHLEGAFDGEAFYSNN